MQDLPPAVAEIARQLVEAGKARTYGTVTVVLEAGEPTRLEVKKTVNLKK